MVCLEYVNVRAQENYQEGASALHLPVIFPNYLSVRMTSYLALILLERMAGQRWGHARHGYWSPAMFARRLLFGRIKEILGGTKNLDYLQGKHWYEFGINSWRHRLIVRSGIWSTVIVDVGCKGYWGLSRICTFEIYTLSLIFIILRFENVSKWESSKLSWGLLSWFE